MVPAVFERQLWQSKCLQSHFNAGDLVHTAICRCLHLTIYGSHYIWQHQQDNSSQFKPTQFFSLRWQFIHLMTVWLRCVSTRHIPSRIHHHCHDLIILSPLPYSIVACSCSAFVFRLQVMGSSHIHSTNHTANSSAYFDSVRSPEFSSIQFSPDSTALSRQNTEHSTVQYVSVQHNPQIQCNIILIVQYRFQQHQQDSSTHFQYGSFHSITVDLRSVHSDRQISLQLVHAVQHNSVRIIQYKSIVVVTWN